MGIFSPPSPTSRGCNSGSQQHHETASGPGGRLRRVFSRKKGSSKTQKDQKLPQSLLEPDGADGAAADKSGPPNCSFSHQEFTADQQKKLKTAFDFFDIDNDGRISSEELQKVLKFLGNKVSEVEAQLMIAEVDENCNGAVEFNEFTKMMSKYHRKTSWRKNINDLTEQSASVVAEDAEILEAFQAFDHNGDNYIDFNELKKTMQFLGEIVSDSDINCMIRQADVDMDGRIDLEEFKRLMAAMKLKGSRDRDVIHY